jgi:hypothetical protein
MEKLTEKYKRVQFGRKVYDVEDVMANHPTSRVHREIVAGAQSQNLLLRHDEKFLKWARVWYGCRVAYAGIEKYLEAEDVKAQDAEGEDGKEEALMDIKNVQKQIYRFDDAVGYDRRKLRQ